MDKARPKIVIAIPTNGSNGRELMSGVFQYLNEHPRWEIQTIITATGVRTGGLEVAASDADGILIAMSCSKELLDKVQSRKTIKIVACDDGIVRLCRGRSGCRTLQLDSVSIGKDVAQYLNSLGRFAAYGFVHGPFRQPWSVDRERGFRSFMPHGMKLHVFHGNDSQESASPIIHQTQLSEWIAGLPKPVAVFGANDRFANEVLIVCRRLGLKVPQQVAVIGCDNDPFVCTNAVPALSSLQLPFRTLGYRAAATLDRMLTGKPVPTKTVYISGSRLFARASTANMPPAAALVEKAGNFIAEHAFDGIRVGDVARHLGVSRTLLDLRFRQMRGESVLSRIQEVRLAEVRRQLVETNNTILQIGRNSGFNDPDNLKRLFKKRFGTSMRQYRQNNAAS